MPSEDSDTSPIAVLGAGHVGLVTAVGFAHHGIPVRVGEPDPRRRGLLEEGRAPFHEPGLDSLLAGAVASGLLSFHADNAVAADGAAAVFVAVPTPPGEGGSADLSFVAAAVRSIAAVVEPGVPVVVKSSVPPGSWRLITRLLEEAGCRGSLVVNPEFLQEGAAVQGVLEPARVVIGSRDALAAARVADLHGVFGAPVVITDPASAELVKYAANAYLAMRITFANAMAEVSDAVGADAADVLEGMGLDPRIGRHFLRPGPGYGGSCFPKDLPALVAAAADHGVDLKLVAAVVETNAGQAGRVILKAERALGDLRGARIALLGLAFKADTDDTRESPALAVARGLIARGAEVHAYDPAARVTEAGIEQAESVMEAAEGADLLLIATEWSEFADLDLERLRSVMHGAVIVDARNLLDKEAALAAGFDYRGMGR